MDALPANTIKVIDLIGPIENLRKVICAAIASVKPTRSP